MKYGGFFRTTTQICDSGAAIRDHSEYSGASGVPIELGARKIRSSSRRLDMIQTTPGGTHGSFEVTCRPRRLTTAVKAIAVCLRSIVFDSSLDIGRRTALGKSLSYLLSSRPREWYTWRMLQTHLFEIVLNSCRSFRRSKELRLTAAPNQSMPAQH